MTYKKIIKWLLVVLFVFGAITSFFGFFHGWPEDTQWKEDQAKVPVLKADIETLLANGTPEWSGKILEDKKVEVKKLSATAVKMAAQVDSLNTLIGKAKKSAKATLEAEKETLKAKVDTINVEIANLNAAINLDKYKTELAEREERINTGNTSVDTILYSTYVMIAMVIISLIVIIFIINSINNPFSLVKLLIGIGVIAGLVIGAWAIAPGPLDPIQSETMSADEISAFDLKMTDTVLYLAYLLFGGTILALITSWIIGAVRK
jgi:hypothetical protein